MRTIVKGKGYDVPARVRGYAERKLRRIERIVEEPADAIVELSVERHRNAADSHLVDVTLVVDGRTVRSRAAGLTHEAGLDAVVDKLERRANDAKTRRISRSRNDHAAALSRRLVAGSTPRDSAGEIVKVKTFDIEPMFDEDAVARMEELGHSFFVFLNAEGDRVNVVYRRTAGGYGLIDPDVRPGPAGSRSRTLRT